MDRFECNCQTSRIECARGSLQQLMGLRRDVPWLPDFGKGPKFLCCGLGSAKRSRAGPQKIVLHNPPRLILLAPPLLATAENLNPSDLTTISRRVRGSPSQQSGVLVLFICFVPFCIVFKADYIL
jgi:hypothetical protein